jgi:hypothetical protein
MLHGEVECLIGDVDGFLRQAREETGIDGGFGRRRRPRYGAFLDEFKVSEDAEK